MDYIESIEVIISIICGVITICSAIFCHKTKRDIQVSAKEIENMVSNHVSTNNGQMAGIINNGLGLKDAKEAAADVFDEKAKNISRIYVQDEEPADLKNGDMWIGGEAYFDFGEEEEDN